MISMAALPVSKNAGSWRRSSSTSSVRCLRSEISTIKTPVQGWPPVSSGMVWRKNSTGTRVPSFSGECFRSARDFLWQKPAGTDQHLPGVPGRLVSGSASRLVLGEAQHGAECRVHRPGAPVRKNRGKRDGGGLDPAGKEPCAFPAAAGASRGPARSVFLSSRSSAEVSVVLQDPELLCISLGKGILFTGA